MQQLSQEWFDARKGRITGSRIGAILGLSPYAKRNDVLREMVREYFGAEREFTGNRATEYGSDRESAAKADFEIETGLKPVDCGLIVHPTFEFLAASPDGLIGDDSGLEIKCPFSGKLKPLSEQPHYHAQIQLCMHVTQRSGWYYYAWTDGESHIEQVQRDDNWLLDRMDELDAFMNEYAAIISDHELAKPHLEPKELDLSDSSDWQELADKYARLKALSDAAAKEVDDVKKQIIDRAKETGSSKVIGCGIQAIRAERKGSIDYTKVPELSDIDLEQYRKKATSYWTIK